MSAIDQIKAPIKEEMERFGPYFRDTMRSGNRMLDFVIRYLLKTKGITDPQTYFEDAVKKLNEKMPPYKAVKTVKLRDTEFQKNTSRKIVRYTIDKTVD